MRKVPENTRPDSNHLSQLLLRESPVLLTSMLDFRYPCLGIDQGLAPARRVFDVADSVVGCLRTPLRMDQPESTIFSFLLERFHVMVPHPQHPSAILPDFWQQSLTRGATSGFRQSLFGYRNLRAKSLVNFTLGSETSQPASSFLISSLSFLEISRNAFPTDFLTYSLSSPFKLARSLTASSG